MNGYDTLTQLGCGCGCDDCNGLHGMGAVSDYDQIKIGGKTYTVNQIIGKNVIAANDTKIYSGPRSTASVKGTIKSGQSIGTVYSYLRPEQADGTSWLMFESSYVPGMPASVYYAPNEIVSGSGLKDQGTLTVKEEIKKEQDAIKKEKDPVGYYLEKYGLPVLLIGGGIILAATYGKAFIQAKLSQPKSSK